MHLFTEPPQGACLVPGAAGSETNLLRLCLAEFMAGRGDVETCTEQPAQRGGMFSVSAVRRGKFGHVCLGDKGQVKLGCSDRENILSQMSPLGLPFLIAAPPAQCSLSPLYSMSLLGPYHHLAGSVFSFIVLVSVSPPRTEDPQGRNISLFTAVARCLELGM